MPSGRIRYGQWVDQALSLSMTVIQVSQSAYVWKHYVRYFPVIWIYVFSFTFPSSAIFIPRPHVVSKGWSSYFSVIVHLPGIKRTHLKVAITPWGPMGDKPDQGFPDRIVALNNLSTEGQIGRAPVGL